MLTNVQHTITRIFTRTVGSMLLWLVWTPLPLPLPLPFPLSQWLTSAGTSGEGLSSPSGEQKNTHRGTGGDGRWEGEQGIELAY